MHIIVKKARLKPARTLNDNLLPILSCFFDTRSPHGSCSRDSIEFPHCAWPSIDAGRLLYTFKASGQYSGRTSNARRGRQGVVGNRGNIMYACIFLGNSIVAPGSNEPSLNRLFGWPLSMFLFTASEMIIASLLGIAVSETRFALPLRRFICIIRIFTFIGQSYSVRSMAFAGSEACFINALLAKATDTLQRLRRL